jgi:hypothetical protein
MQNDYGDICHTEILQLVAPDKHVACCMQFFDLSAISLFMSMMFFLFAVMNSSSKKERSELFVQTTAGSWNFNKHRHFLLSLPKTGLTWLLSAEL